MGYAKSVIQPQTEGFSMDAKTGANIKTGKLSVGDKTWSFPIYGG